MMLQVEFLSCIICFALIGFVTCNRFYLNEVKLTIPSESQLETKFGKSIRKKRFSEKLMRLAFNLT